MRIILVQAEIQLALQAYVMSQININSGQDVKIEFKNTRSEDGLTAEIDIVSSINTSLTKDVLKTSNPDKIENQMPVTGNTLPVETTRVVEETKPVEQTPVAAAIVPEPIPDPVAEVPAPAAPAPSKSLFSGLGKPVHDTPTN